MVAEITAATAKWIEWVDPWYACTVDLEDMVDRLLDDRAGRELDADHYAELCRLCGVPP